VANPAAASSEPQNFQRAPNDRAAAARLDFRAFKARLDPTPISDNNNNNNKPSPALRSLG
jgi:hypothetical protein